ncbi:glycosyltransferase family 4 protein [Thauera sp. SDU_THAU2]|uniref:glycosyltransferase family 4 protein n=1 Tax=Thauera sp. SDU_THAU2 TaxID=3136633 RepID=UPI00311E9E56
MHILFLTDNFPPEVNAPASRTFEHCREWRNMGHEITVITCAPNFPKGKVFDGYRNRLWQAEEVEGIRVIRVWSYITANEGFVKRILDYQSFMLSAVLASPFVRKVDLIVGTSPQFFTACAAYAASRMKRVPWVFELRDLWPESIRAVGAMKESKALDLVEKLELFLYRQANAVVTVTNAFRENLIRRGIDGQKIDVVTNGVDISRFKPRQKDAELLARLGLEGKFIAGYIGTHGMAHALDTLLEAAAKLKALPDGDRYRLLLLGDGACKADLVLKARSMGLDNVVFVDSVSKQEVVRYWSLLDVSIIHLRKTELFTTVIPSKLFECMGMGIPVLHGVSGESADIVQEEGAGIVFEPENADALCDGVVRMFEDRTAYERYRSKGLGGARKYDRKELARRMLTVLEAVVDDARGKKRFAR